jgi:hypothetical protein
MINYKQLLADLSNIAFHHEQIMSYGFGDLAQCTNDIETKQEPRYTRMYVVPGDVALNENHIHYRFAVIIMDKLNVDLSNMTEVMSDTLEIVKDVWTILKQSYTAEYGDFSFDIIPDEEPDVVPFIERFETILGGWTLNLSFQVAFDYNSCTPPVIGEFGFPEDQPFESYKMIIDNIEEFGLLHEQVNSFGFGDNAQLTNDIITKKEPRYPRLYIEPDITKLHVGYVDVNLRIFFVDKLDDDLSNLQDVLSDQLEIVKDLFAKLTLSEYDAAYNSPVEMYLERTETILAGWILNVSMVQKFSFDRCVLPTTSFIPGLKWEEVFELWKNVDREWDKI